MQPLLIGNYDVGVQKNLTPFMIPEKAFPDMLNAFVYRGRIQRKAGYTLLGRLRRELNSASLGINTIVAGGAGVFTFNLFTLMGVNVISPNAQLDPGTVAVPLIIAIAAPINQILTDNTGAGGFTIGGAGPITAATVNYSTGVLTLTFSGAAGPATATITGAYFPGLPVMGIRTQEDESTINQEKTIFFDTVYAYRRTSTFFELPSTLAVTWSGTDSQQFWSTNYQVNALNVGLFWVTNGVAGLHAYTLDQVSLAAVGPPSTARITTGQTNNFVLGDIVVFVSPSGGVVNANANPVFSTITNIVNGTTFDVTNPGTGVFVNAGPGLTGLVIANRLIARNVAGQDGIRIYDDTTWANFNPSVNSLTVVTGALLLVPYKNRMVLLSTIEGNNTALSNVSYRQRARWSQIGSSIDLAMGWRDDVVGRGGFEDAATNERIVSCAFVKDELIVYFERSTWKLLYTGNELGPFVWQRISSELGAESTFTAVNFDDGLLCMGNVGVHQCNGSVVKRIDEVVPDEIFDIHNGSDGPRRASGIRDFYQEIVYFAYPTNKPNISAGGKIFFPNKMMIYNYRNNTFSFFDDNATCFGYFQKITGKTWAELTDFIWEAWGIPWNSGALQSGFPSVNFGNQQGFVETVEPLISSNGASLMVQGLSGSTVTSPQHNLFVGQYVRFSGIIGATLDQTIAYQVLTVPTENTFTIDGTATGTYLGGGIITVLTNIEIPTKQFTPFWTQGTNYVLKHLDVLVNKTAAGELQTDIYVDFNVGQSMTDTNTGYVLGSSTLSTAPEGSEMPYYSFQGQQNQIWKRFYSVATGETFQVVFSFNDTEMRSKAINESGVVIHGMIFYFEPAGTFY